VVDGEDTSFDFDELVRQEVEAAFAGLEESLASGDDEKALALIQSQGKTVLSNVLQRMEEEGELLSATLSTRIEEIASAKTKDVLDRYDSQLGGLQAEVATERVKLRAEMENLETLNREYQDLIAGKDGTSLSSKDKIISAVALLAGVTYLGAAITETLRIVSTGTGDVLTVGLNGALGAVGVGYHIYRKQGSS